MAKKLRIGVIVGGKSSEHEVSLVSGSSVMDHLDREKYDVIPIGITKEGKWVLGPNVVSELKSGSQLHLLPALLASEPARAGLVTVGESGVAENPVDVFFPVVHGSLGEDGALQGLLEMLGVAYVGCGVLASSVGMDKWLFKDLMRSYGLPQVPYVGIREVEWRNNRSKLLESIAFSYPRFVKPANMGSSVGITKAHDAAELTQAIEAAFAYDDRVLVEEGVPDVHEIEIAALGGEELTLSVPGEIFPSNEFYDYNAKYVDGASTDQIPADLTSEKLQRVQSIATTAFRAVDGWGMARIDCFISRSSGEVYLNEMNTIPGFTSISMYAKLFQASGISYPELLDRLIVLAVQRKQQQTQKQTSYSPSSNWYQR